MHIENKTLFQLQAELIDTKVELAVNKAINQVVEQIINLRQEVHREMGGLKHEVHQEMNGLRHEMHEMKEDMLERLSQVNNRLFFVEGALGKRTQVRGEIRTRFLDLTYKLGTLVALAALSNVVPFVMMTKAYTLFQ